MTSFEFNADPYTLKTTIKMMLDINCHGYFTVTQSGLTGSCISESEGTAMTFMLGAELTTFKYNTPMVLSSQDLSRLFKRVTKKDKLTLSDTKDGFVITSVKKNMSIVSKIKKLNTQFKIIRFDDSAYNNDVNVDSKNFFIALASIGDCDIVNIKQQGTGVVIKMCIDKIKQSVAKLGDTDGDIKFSSDYDLYSLLKIRDVQNVSSVLTLSFKMGYPLRITAPTNVGHIVFYIKPMIYEHIARTYEVTTN